MKPPTMKQGSPINFQTPKEAATPLLPYLKKEWIIWECACGRGNIVNYLKENGYSVIGTDIVGKFNEGNIVESCKDFLIWKPDKFDCIVTNPPYTLKDRFLERLYQLNKPFAVLMPLTALEGKKRGVLYRKYGIELIIPNKRINFETPSGEGSGAWFQTAWFCWKLNLPNQLNFIDYEKNSNQQQEKLI